MSTWQIFSDAGNNFQWKISGQVLHSKPVDEPNGAALSERHSSSHHLPSMADLLLQGCSNLLENGDEGGGNAPMFRTGLGKSVLLKQSSIAKALSVLAEDDDDDAVFSGDAQAGGNACSFSNSLFCTGSGKPVDISSTGLVRARTLLGLEDDNDDLNFQGFQRPMKAYGADKQLKWQNLSHLETTKVVKNSGIMDDGTSLPRSFLISKTGIVGNKAMNDVNPNLLLSEMHNSGAKLPPIKFQTAGGKSLSVSSEALKRARSLLGDPDLGTFLNEGDTADSALSVFRDSRFNDASSNKEKDFYSGFTYPGAAKSKHISKAFISPLRSSSNQVPSSSHSETIISGSNLIKKFDAVEYESIHRFNCNSPSASNSLGNGSFTLDSAIDNSIENCIGSRINPLARSLRRPLVDISNTNSTTFTNNQQSSSEKRRLGRGTSISLFKRPRSSKFTTPLNRDVSFAPSGLPTLSSENSCNGRTVSTRYPFQGPRMSIKEYFGVPYSDKSMHFKGQAGWIKSDAADEHTFRNESGLSCIGVEAFHHMLAQSGASLHYASKEWVTNHYKWIVWKLACYERFYKVKSAAKFLTVSNVLEELKYRYEREVNHGHRSAIKRILDGDAPPSSMMVLCISAIDFNCKPEIETHSLVLNGSESNNAAKVELTDGWYSVDALLDVSLSKHLASGKLFVGQKLRVWGAGLCGWIGPISPLEASKTASLSLHINGTYRAHWADRLGFCKSVGPPLAFRCIKGNGGPIPWTLVGVTRIYPVLYKEKLGNGESIVRSERMEVKMMQLYNQRRTTVVEGTVSEFQRGMKGYHVCNDSDSEEGAKILKILETAAEPEVLMAEMSPEQLTSFASYKAKLEATRQWDMDKAIEKALQDAGLGEREVTPFMRIRVVGLTNHHGKGVTKEGLITIWNPTERQQSDLVEGQAYSITGLIPVNCASKTLYLQARGTTTIWQPLSPMAVQHFEPFFHPRISISLSNLGEVPLWSEFDIAAIVLYVGEVYTSVQQRRQWVFVTDSSSITIGQSEEISMSLLAISFCSPCIDEVSFAPIDHNLAGSIVGFYNLMRGVKDHKRDLWIAEATENSTYSTSFDSPNCLHLKNAAASTQRWAKISSSIIDKLKEKVLFIIGDG